MMLKISPDLLKPYLGVPWVYRESDCWAIFRMCSEGIIGVRIPDLTLPESPSPRENAEIFHDQLSSPKWEKVNEPSIGNAVVFYGSSEKAVHIGFVLGCEYMLHSMGSQNSVTYSSCDKIKDMVKNGVFKRYEFYNYTG